MINTNGNRIPNQFEIWADGGVYFQSYNATVAFKKEGEVTLFDPYWNNYSATTNRYLLAFLREGSIKDIRAKVKSGEYTVA